MLNRDQGGCLLLHYLVFQILFRVPHLLRLAQVFPVITIGTIPDNLFPLRGQTQIGRENREDSTLRHHAQKSRRTHVDAAERESLHSRRRSYQFRRSIPSGLPPAKLKLFVEQQISGSVPALHRQRRQSASLLVRPAHLS